MNTPMKVDMIRWRKALIPHTTLNNIKGGTGTGSTGGSGGLNPIKHQGSKP